MKSYIGLYLLPLPLQIVNPPPGYSCYLTGSKSSEVISELLQAGVDVNRRNVLGMNALLLVAGYADERLVKMVLDAGADPSSANDFGHTALHLAIVGKRSQLKVSCFSYAIFS